MLAIRRLHYNCELSWKKLASIGKHLQFANEWKFKRRMLKRVGNFSEALLTFKQASPSVESLLLTEKSSFGLNVDAEVRITYETIYPCERNLCCRKGFWRRCCETRTTLWSTRRVLSSCTFLVGVAFADVHKEQTYQRDIQCFAWVLCHYRQIYTNNTYRKSFYYLVVKFISLPTPHQVPYAHQWRNINSDWHMA